MSEVEKLLEAARAGLDRVECTQLTSEISSGALVVDIRPEADRVGEGTLPGAVVIESMWALHIERRGHMGNTSLEALTAWLLNVES